MGKSSLAVRTIDKLNAAGVRTAFVDLTRIGGATVTPEQWYAGLLLETGRALGLRSEAAAWLKDHREVGPAQRFFSFLNEVALVRLDGPLVLMLDEIDAVRSLAFPTDELFAGLRQLHNGRSSDADLGRLTICLLGAALPSDLIRDPRVTPFNVGRRVELHDFTREEAEPLAKALPDDAALAKLLGWTGGHPFLTQALGSEIGKGGDVDAVVNARYLDARARDTDTNLTDVGRRLLGEGDPNVGDRQRADTLALYERLLRGKPVPDDESNPASARIKMSGVARLKGGLLKPRNRIYERVFDRRWVRDNMPGQELRRQRRALWKGAIRASAVAGAVVAVISTLAVVALRDADRATRAEAAARYDAYVATMQTMALKQDEGDGAGARRTLEALRKDPARGWEWDYWHRVMVGDAAVLDWHGADLPVIAADPQGAWIGVTDADSVSFFRADGRFARRVTLPHAVGQSWIVNAFRRGDRFLLHDATSHLTLIVDARTGKVLRRKALSGFVIGVGLNWDSPDDRWTLATALKPAPHLRRVDLETLDETDVGEKGVISASAWFTPQGGLLAMSEVRHNAAVLILRRQSDLRRVRGWPMDSLAPANFDPSGKTLVAADGNGLRRFDVATGRTLWEAPFLGGSSGVQFSPDGRRLLVTRTGGRPGEEFDVEGRSPRRIRTLLDAWTALYLSKGQILTCSDVVRILPPTAGLPNHEEPLPGRPFTYGIVEAQGWATFVGKHSVLSIPSAEPVRGARTIRKAEGPKDASGRFGTVLDGHSFVFKDLQGKYPTLNLPTPNTGYWNWMPSPDGDLLALAVDASTMAVYDVRSGRRVATLKETAPSVVMRFSDDERFLASGDSRGGVTVWETKHWTRVASGRVGRASIFIVRFSEDESRVAAGSELGELGVVNLRTGEARPFSSSGQRIGSIAWSPDGRRLATGGGSREVRIWDPATGRDLGLIGRHASNVTGLWFTPDGRTLCSVDIGGTMKLWMTEDHL